MSGLISPATLEQIRSANEIVEVIGAYLGPLQRAGASFRTLCPFHKEKTPSFHVNPQKQIFHCFGCQKGGDVFTFVKEYENIGFMDAVRRLAERARIPLQFDNKPGQQQSRHLKDTLLHIHEQITQRWQAALANDAGGQIARDYLQKRGVSAEAIKLFRLGYAPEAWDDTVNWAKSKGYEIGVVEQAGLILKSEKGTYYDRFRGRLMFPICDEQGRVIGFSGRVLLGDEKTAKYVNSPETPIFTKGKVFFGLDKSKRALLDAKTAVICEGQLDLIACYMVGVRNVVAPQGTAFTSDHVRVLKRYVEEVVLCFDSDNAGQQATVRAVDHLMQAGITIRVAIVPSPHDPDSFIREFGANAFRDLIVRAEGFLDFYLNRLCSIHDITSDKGRLSVLNAMGEQVQKTGNLVLIENYAQKTGLRLGVSKDSVRAEFAKIRKILPNSIGTEVLPEPEGTESKDPSAVEFWFLRLLFSDSEAASWVSRHLDPEWLEHPVVRQIVIVRFRNPMHSVQGVAALLNDLPGVDAKKILTKALADERVIPNPIQQLNDLLLRLRNKALDRRLSDLKRELEKPDLSDYETQEILREQQELRLMKSESLEEKLRVWGTYPL